MGKKPNMSGFDEVRERFVSHQDAAREAFEEVAARLEQLEAGNEEMKDRMRAKMQIMKDANLHQREKLHRLREKYMALLDMYNSLAEEAKERSDSSSSSDDEDDDENCSIM